MISTFLPRPAPARGSEGSTVSPPARQWDGRRLSSLPSRWLLAPAFLAAVGVGALTALGPLKALLALLALTVMVCVWKWPVLAAYLIIGLTPLTVGISRGAVLPLVRPNEAVDLLVGGTLALRGIVRLRTGQMPSIRFDRVELSLLLMAVTSSVVPLLWMLVRQEQISSADILYALVLWKFLGLYVIVRVSVSTDQQILRCLRLSVAAASVVALLAILQSLDLLGVPRFLNDYYAYSADLGGPAGGRASSTLGLPAATADLMIYNLAIVSGLWIRYRRHRLLLSAAAALFVFGALAAGEFSSAIGLVVGLICIAAVTNSPRLLTVFVPAGLIGSVLVWPVISKRLSGFQSPYGLPPSWLGRLNNLRTYFWPKLFSDWNFLLGVRPAARIAVPSQITGYVWIESGYTWLLWGGGIPLLASFIFFVVVTSRRGWLAARYGLGAASVAGTATFVAVCVVTVLMTFDPHLTYRGAADAMFGLIALAAPRRSLQSGQGALSEPGTTLGEVRYGSG